MEIASKYLRKRIVKVRWEAFLYTFQESSEKERRSETESQRRRKGPRGREEGVKEVTQATGTGWDPELCLLTHIFFQGLFYFSLLR